MFSRRRSTSPQSPGDLPSYQAAFGAKRCVGWHRSCPIRQPGHSLQKPHIYIPYSLGGAVRAGALSRTKRTGTLEAAGILRRESLSNAGCPTFRTSGAVLGQLTGQRERKKGVTVCLPGPRLQTPSKSY